MPQFDPAVDAYLLQFPTEVQAILRAFRKRIHALAPDAEERMAYGMPAYKLHGKPLVYFAAFSKHIGFYATPTGHSAFSNELAAYKQGKGSVQFPLHQAMPWELIDAIILFRKQENEQHQRN